MWYDEAGNRVRKLVEREVNNSGGTGDGGTVLGGGSYSWTPESDEYYVRDVSGKEIAIYKNGAIEQWNMYGSDNVGKIDADKHRFFYLKDHLGTIRAVLDTTNTVIFAGDYDAWGYPLENRIFNGTNDVQKYQFTGKERDIESGLDGINGYDYFGARYYNSRIANWTTIDPLFEKHKQWTPYNYVLRNPLHLIDPDGKQEKAGNELTSWWITDQLVSNAEYEVRQEMIRDVTTNSMSTSEKIAKYGDFYENYASGRADQTGDEMLAASIVVPELRFGLAIENNLTRESVVTTTSLMKSGLSLSENITEKEAGEQIANYIGKNRISLGYGELDLTGNAHVIKLGGGNTMEIPTPHLKPIYFQYSSGKGFIPKAVRNATRKASMDDLLRAVDIINSKF